MTITDNYSNAKAPAEAASESSGKMQHQAADLMTGSKAGSEASAQAQASADYKLAGANLPDITLTDHMPAGKGDAHNRSVVVVEKGPHHRTHVFQKINGEVEEVVNVPNATGKGTKGTVTPEGRFTIIGKEANPWWYPPESIGGHPVPPGPNNPLGTHKIRTSAYDGRIMLHGTNRPDQIGTNASHGCIRHLNSDIPKVFNMVHKGDAVYITKNINGYHIQPSDFDAIAAQKN